MSNISTVHNIQFNNLQLIVSYSYPKVGQHFVLRKLKVNFFGFMYMHVHKLSVNLAVALPVHDSAAP